MSILFLTMVTIVLCKLYSMVLYNAILRAVLYPICNNIISLLNTKQSMKYKEMVTVIRK